MRGALLINKTVGPTSAEVVDSLKPVLCDFLSVTKRDLPALGHTGTLDPFASGLLIVCVGAGTKLSRYLLNETKTYRATAQFGIGNASGDCSDPVTETGDFSRVTLEAASRLAIDFCAREYWQTPPMTSAKKVDGKKLYELARQGIEVDRKPVLCKITNFRITRFELPLVEFEVTVSSGTFIRTLAQDFAKELKSIAILNTLTRTQIGEFRLEQAVTVEQYSKILESSDRNIAEAKKHESWIGFDQILCGLPRVSINERESTWLRQGRQETAKLLAERGKLTLAEDVSLIACFEGEQLVATIRFENDWKIERVF